MAPVMSRPCPSLASRSFARPSVRVQSSVRGVVAIPSLPSSLASLASSAIILAAVVVSPDAALAGGRDDIGGSSPKAGGSAAYCDTCLAGPDFNALADRKKWDGRTNTGCELGPAGKKCRESQISDVDNSAYGGVEGRGAGFAKQGEANAAMGESYKPDSVALIDKIEAVLSLDPLDPKRVDDVPGVQKQSQVWVSQYAKGGAAAKKSAGKLYGAVDALNGHIASRGLAPLPKRTTEFVLGACQEARTLLSTDQ